jgi:hypothetical protein
LLKRIISILPLVIFLLLFGAPKIYAHPGNTAADGCHYCRTNCAKWGEVEGARHCHGGGSAPAPVYISTPVPTPVPTLKPTALPIKATAVPIINPTNTPQVKSASTKAPQASSITESEEEASAADALLGFGILGAMIGVPIWGLRKAVRKWNSRVS